MFFYTQCSVYPGSKQRDSIWVTVPVWYGPRQHLGHRSGLVRTATVFWGTVPVWYGPQQHLGHRSGLARTATAFGSPFRFGTDRDSIWVTVPVWYGPRQHLGHRSGLVRTATAFGSPFRFGTDRGVQSTYAEVSGMTGARSDKAPTY